MAVLNTPDAYGVLSKALHWVLVVLLLLTIVSGLIYTRLSWPEVDQASHEIGGKVVLVLAVVRLALRLVAPVPRPLPGHRRWEVGLSRTVHWALYLVLFAFPLSGWAMVSAGEYAETGALPTWLAPLGAYDLWTGLHFALKWALLGLLVLHVAGALKHRFIDGDGTLRRMWFYTSGD